MQLREVMKFIAVLPLYFLIYKPFLFIKSFVLSAYMVLPSLVIMSMGIGLYPNNFNMADLEVFSVSHENWITNIVMSFIKIWFSIVWDLGSWIGSVTFPANQMIGIVLGYSIVPIAFIWISFKIIRLLASNGLEA